MSVGKINVSSTLRRAERLLREDKSASPALRAVVEVLITLIQLLIQKVGTNSTNSSLPPSQDPHRQRGSKGKGAARQRRPGGQPGHEGATLQPDPHPDRIEPIAIDCRTLPAGRYKPAGYEARQVIDIEIHKHVTEYRAEILEDERGRQFVAPFPEGVTRPVQYGNTVKAQAVYLSQWQLLPYERVGDHFSSQCGLPLSPGSVFNFNREAFGLLERFEAIAVQQLIRQPVLHADETGINLNGKLGWLHNLSNAEWTLFFVHERRGAEAMLAMGVLPHFHGRLCHDHWKAYFQFDCLHSLCNAHHLRELKRAQEEGQRWAPRMHALLLTINEATRRAGGCLSERQAQRFSRRYHAILDAADRECPPPTGNRIGKRRPLARTKARNLLERLRLYETETLRFMTDPQVPFTNNQGENDLRMTKVQQKISGCFRSSEGAKIFCRVRSYLSTCRKHDLGATEALKLLFSAHLPDFIPKLE